MSFLFSKSSSNDFSSSFFTFQNKGFKDVKIREREDRTKEDLYSDVLTDCEDVFFALSLNHDFQGNETCVKTVDEIYHALISDKQKTLSKYQKYISISRERNDQRGFDVFSILCHFLNDEIQDLKQKKKILNKINKK